MDPKRRAAKRGSLFEARRVCGSTCVVCVSLSGSVSAENPLTLIPISIRLFESVSLNPATASHWPRIAHKRARKKVPWADRRERNQWVCSSVALEGSSEKTCTAGKRARSDAVKQICLGRVCGFDGEASSVLRKCHKPGAGPGLAEACYERLCISTDERRGAVRAELSWRDA